MNTQTITVAQARSDFSNLLAQADLLDHRFVIARRGKPKAALVSVRDLADRRRWSGPARRFPLIANRPPRPYSRLACCGR